MTESRVAKLKIRTIGDLGVARDGEELTLPASRKTRALLAYVALVEQPHSRQSLCELLWGIPDDPRGALRWSLSKLRSVIDTDATKYVEADRGWIDLAREHVDVDLDAIAAAIEDDDTGAEDLDRIWHATKAGMLLDCDISGQEEFELWLSHQRAQLEELRAMIARRMAENEELALESRRRWVDRWMDALPFDRDAGQLAIAIRQKQGFRIQAAQLTRELEERFADADLEFTADVAVPDQVPIGQHEPDESSRLPVPRQSIRFVQAQDGTSIAWASVRANGGGPLVKAANWLSHLELDWEAPIWSPLFRTLSQHHRLIRYDERGCGLSDWEVDDIDFESFVTDLELVVDEAGLETFPLLGISQGAAVSIEYAARHPERVSKLILFGGYDRGWRHTASTEEEREREAVMVLTETGWGRDNPAYRHVFSRTFMPDATAEELAWFDDFQRRTTSANNAVRFLDAFSRIDVSHRLKYVSCPTLVIHSRGDQRIPISVGAALASGIPDARFAGIESPNHLLLGREPASEQFLKLITEFLAE